MKKLLVGTTALAITLMIGTSALAQSIIQAPVLSPSPAPTNATRQRKATESASQTPADAKPVDGPFTASDAPEDKTSAKSSPVTGTAGSKGVDKSKEQKPLAEVTSDGQTNRTDQGSEESSIVPYYNNFFTTYRLGPEDVISVSVFGQDRYSRQGIVIPPSGRISLALIPDGIFVNGKTVDQVAELIKKRYDEYIIDPQVSVALDRAGSYRYSVVGDVGQPGIRLMSRRLSVSEAIAEAGGVLQTGNRKKVVVLRRQADGTLKSIPVNLSAIYRGQAPDAVYLAPGDQVIVPGNTLKKLQTIMGFTQVLSFARLFTGGF